MLSVPQAAFQENRGCRVLLGLGRKEVGVTVKLGIKQPAPAVQYINPHIPDHCRLYA